ncbi:MAG TPA: insulinase family protein, partial [Clostridia bacterium]|nr:insulinase family protein [Clostridia bacterium]
MKTKILSWLLVLCLTAGLSGIALAQTEAQPEALPGVGGSLHGFTVIESGSFDLLGVPATLFQHDKTGALVYCIQSSDVNRAFSIAFRTPALDNTGAPHVFEHITISGSDKYPSSSLFFPLVNQTYNTFINAMTGNCYTIYPMASLSEEQLFKLADVYLDGVFHPMLYRDERLMLREAWRYELPDAQSSLTLTGTVYNEMKGARTIARLANQNLQAALYPDSIVGNDSGGDPEYIPDLTYGQLLSFHDAYYHPSNAFVVLYGDLDFARFLELLDTSYFGQYDRKDIAIETGAIPPQDGLVTASLPFPVEANANTANGSYIEYGFVANGATKE